MTRSPKGPPFANPYQPNGAPVYHTNFEDDDNESGDEQFHGPEHPLDQNLASLWSYLSEAQMKDVDYINMVYNNINNVFDLERYLSTLIANDATLNFIVSPPGVATPLTWAFLHVKRIVRDLNFLAMALHYDGCGDSERRPDCMVMNRAGKNSPKVICASTHPPEYCDAMKYIFHTLNWASSMVNYTHIDCDQLLSIVNPDINHHMLTITYRRIFQIFTHACYFHPEVFQQHEETTKMYQRTLALGIYTKMLQNTPLPDYKVDFTKDDITGLNEESYMRQLTFLVSNATLARENADLSRSNSHLDDMILQGSFGRGPRTPEFEQNLARERRKSNND